MSRRNRNNRYKGKNFNRDRREMAENFSQLAVGDSSSSGSDSSDESEIFEANFPVAMW